MCRRRTNFNKRNEQNSRGHRRKQNIRGKRLSFIIACEDKVSSPTYLTIIVNELRECLRIKDSSLVIANHSNTHPRGVLQDLENHVTRDGKNYTDFDHKWILIDRDEIRVEGGGHSLEEYNRAFQDAKTLNVKVAFANDSFELWYLLHFDYIVSSTPRDQILTRLIQKLKNKNTKKFSKLNSKSIKTAETTIQIYEELEELQGTAINNAKKLMKRNEAEGEIEHINPSTNIHVLVELLKSLG